MPPAAAADINTGGHLFSPWAALASQIRLTADSIDPTIPAQPSDSTPAPRPETAAVGNSLRRAAEALDQAPPTRTRCSGSGRSTSYAVSPPD